MTRTSKAAPRPTAALAAARNAALAATLAAVAALVPPAPAAAQTATTFTACYVPAVGAIYLTGMPGLPSACLAETHVAFSWTEGGSLADGSVTAAKLADGAVVGAKVAEGAITIAKLAFDPATQAELDAAMAGAGSLDVYEDAVLGNQDVSTSCTARTDLATLTLPGPARYSLAASGYVFAQMGTSAKVVVDLVTDVQLLSHGEMMILDTNAVPYAHNRVLDVPGASATVYLKACRSIGDSPPIAFSTVLVATRVGESTTAAAAVPGEGATAGRPRL